MISARTKDALAAAKKRGVKLGGNRGVKPGAKMRAASKAALQARTAARGGRSPRRSRSYRRPARRHCEPLQRASMIRESRRHAGKANGRPSRSRAYWNASATDRRQLQRCRPVRDQNYFLRKPQYFDLVAAEAAGSWIMAIASTSAFSIFNSLASALFSFFCVSRATVSQYLLSSRSVSLVGCSIMAPGWRPFLGIRNPHALSCAARTGCSRLKIAKIAKRIKRVA